MSQELQKASNQELQPAPEGVSLLAVIARAASDPTVDVDKMQRLLEMHERLMRTKSEVEFKAALARIQPEMPRVTKHGEITVNGQVRSRYAKYEDVDTAIRPLLAKEGFSVDFDTRDDSGKLTVIMRVSHREGHSESRQITLALDTSGSKNVTQGIGSTFAYGKRYLICGFFNIITTDTDDDGAGGCITPEQVMTIETLVRDTGAPLGKFLEYIGASSIDAIPATHYDRAVSALQRKAAKR